MMYSSLPLLMNSTFVLFILLQLLSEGTLFLFHTIHNKNKNQNSGIIRQCSYCCLALQQQQKNTFFKNTNNYYKQQQSNNNNKKKGGIITRIPIQGRYKNITISSIGVGTWSWGNRFLYNYNDQTDDTELYDAYQYVRNNGITLFDTADSYGTLNYNGRAEILLGQFERQYILDKQQQQGEEDMNQVKQQQFSSFLWFGNKNKNSFRSNKNNNNKKEEEESYNNIRQVATKLAPYPWRLNRQNMILALQGSLRRIKESKVCIAQTHWSTNNYLPIQEKALWDGLGDLYELGFCDAIGVSNYGPKQLQKIINYYTNERQTKDNNSRIPVGTAQIQYSLLTYADPITRDMNDICKEQNVQLIAYSPLCLGLLSGKYNLDNINTNIKSIPRRSLFRELLPGIKKLLNTMEVLSIDKNITMSQIAIQWTICKNTIPIPGCRTKQQAIETIDSVTKVSLSNDEITELDQLALSVSKPMIQNIFQTK